MLLYSILRDCLIGLCDAFALVLDSGALMGGREFVGERYEERSVTIGNDLDIEMSTFLVRVFN